MKTTILLPSIMMIRDQIYGKSLAEIGLELSLTVWIFIIQMRKTGLGEPIFMSTVQFSLIIAEAGSTREPHQHLVLLNQSRTRSLLASLEMLATSTVLMMSKARDGKVQVQVQKSSKKNLLYKVQSSTGHDTGQDKNTSRNDSKKSEYKDVQICTTDLKNCTLPSPGSSHKQWLWFAEFVGHKALCRCAWWCRWPDSTTSYDRCFRKAKLILVQAKVKNVEKVLFRVFFTFIKATWWCLPSTRPRSVVSNASDVCLRLLHTNTNWKLYFYQLPSLRFLPKTKETFSKNQKNYVKPLEKHHQRRMLGDMPSVLTSTTSFC